jgi:hypothetical protein
MRDHSQRRQQARVGAAAKKRDVRVVREIGCLAKNKLK